MVLGIKPREPHESEACTLLLSYTTLTFGDNCFNLINMINKEELGEEMAALLISCSGIAETNAKQLPLKVTFRSIYLTWLKPKFH